MAEARWTRVSNAHFLEAKVFVSPTGDNPDLIPWDTLPVIPVRQASLLIKDQPVGAWLTARVRAVGAKGPSPWTVTVSATHHAGVPAGGADGPAGARAASHLTGVRVAARSAV